MQFSPRGEVLGHQKHKLAFSVIGGVVQLLAVVLVGLQLGIDLLVAVDAAGGVVVRGLLHLALLVYDGAGVV